MIWEMISGGLVALLFLYVPPYVQDGANLLRQGKVFPFRLRPQPVFERLRKPEGYELIVFFECLWQLSYSFPDEVPLGPQSRSNV